jgi:hypothetical protein
MDEQDLDAGGANAIEQDSGAGFRHSSFSVRRARPVKPEPIYY